MEVTLFPSHSHPLSVMWKELRFLIALVLYMIFSLCFETMTCLKHRTPQHLRQNFIITSINTILYSFHQFHQNGTNFFFTWFCVMMYQTSTGIIYLIEMKLKRFRLQTYGNCQGICNVLALSKNWIKIK